MSCPYGDDVIAVFLDGDLPQGDQDVDHGLVEHLATCPDCQEALQQARRLDAALATSSGVAVDAELAERLLHDALAEAAADAVTAPDRVQEETGFRLRSVPLLLGAAALVLLGVLIDYLLIQGWWDRGGASPDKAPLAVQQPAAAGADADVIPLPELPTGARAGARRAAPRMLAPQPRARIPEHLVLAAVLRDDRQLLRQVVLPALAVARAPAWRWLRDEARLLHDHVREQAGRKLLRSPRAAARRELLAYLARANQDPVLDRILDRARADTRFVSFVRGELRRDPDGMALRAAARLGEPSLDRLLRDACRGKPARCDRLAAALASVEHRAGRTRLLLDLWQALADRGLVSDSNDLVKAWFADLPAATTLELAALARATAKASRRRQCILALGARRDPGALPYLLELVAGPHHGEATLAGHAMSQLRPADVDAQLLALQRRSRRPHLLLAALAGMRSPRVQARLTAMGLTKTEREFLATGRFSLQQFTLAARLFRERRRLTD
ncbi:MAG: hypothetical protein ACYTGW_10130 [Planctomycetota bacterium]|jgi:hypothetical protein